MFIGFTGTPLLKADKEKSIEVFGTYILGQQTGVDSRCRLKGGKNVRSRAARKEFPMARRSPRPEATQQVVLKPFQQVCDGCGGALWVAHHKKRTVTTLEGIYDIRLVVRQCVNSQCQEYHHRYRPEEEGSW